MTLSSVLKSIRTRLSAAVHRMPIEQYKHRLWETERDTRIAIHDLEYKLLYKKYIPEHSPLTLCCRLFFHKRLIDDLKGLEYGDPWPKEVYDEDECKALLLSLIRDSYAEDIAENLEAFDCGMAELEAHYPINHGPHYPITNPREQLRLLKAKRHEQVRQQWLLENAQRKSEMTEIEFLAALISHLCRAAFEPLPPTDQLISTVHEEDSNISEMGPLEATPAITEQHPRHAALSFCIPSSFMRSGSMDILVY